jgi:hypothetical protein
MTKQILYGLATALALVSSALGATPWATPPVSFNAPRVYPIGTELLPGSSAQLRFTATGDFNGDDHPDLAVADPGLEAVWILINTGDGTFQAPQKYSIGTPVQAVAVGDFNGDGKPDIAVATGNGVSVLLNNGQGTFGSPIAYAIASGTSYLAVADFDGDGKLGLAVLGTDNSDAPSNEIFTLLGNGDGTFRAGFSFSLGTTISGLAVADLDGDGQPDLVAWADDAFKGVWVLMGEGKGKVKAPEEVADLIVGWVTLGDFNGDGNIDMAIGGFSGITILLGTGDGRFETGETYSAGFPHYLAAADLNGDGKLDLVSVDQGVQVLPGNGDGTFSDPSIYLSGFDTFYFFAVADFSGAGKPGLAITAQRSVIILPGNGTGGFPQLTTYVAGRCDYGGISGFVLADVNGDGTLDVITESTECAGSVLLGTPSGGFGPQIPYSTPGGQVAVAVGDFNGDGKPDLAVANGGRRSPTVSVLLGNGDGTFQTAVTYPVGRKSADVAIGDFNGDGNLDLAVVDRAGPVTILLGKGDGTFTAGKSIALKGGFVAVADLNGDGKTDLIVGSIARASILLGNGDGTFQAPMHYHVRKGAKAFALADLNGDGNLDLVAAGRGPHGDPTGNSGYSILLGNGDGTFQPAVHNKLPFPTGALMVADFDGDGKPDLAMANGELGAVWVLIGDGTGKFSTPRQYFYAGVDTSGLGVTGTNKNGSPARLIVSTETEPGLTVVTNTAP